MPSEQGTRWCFTHNNWTQQVYDRYLALDTRYLVIGKETGDNGTPHLQGFFILSRNKRLGGLRSFFTSVGLQHGHFELARGTNDQAADYCKKDGDYFERGTYPAARGQRSDISGTIEDLRVYQAGLGRPITTPEVIREHPAFYLRYPRVPTVVRALFTPPSPQASQLHGWQASLETTLSTPCTDDRSVLFYVDTEGGAGKTWFCRYMEQKYDYVQMVGTGSSRDIAYMLDESKSVFLFNIERGGSEYLSYRLLEQLKDKRVLSTKYQPRLKHWYTNVHVVVFMNEEPDQEKMTADRYIVMRYNEPNFD